MLRRRLIPKLQLKKPKQKSVQARVLVTTLEFGKSVEIGDPVAQAKIYQAQAADELIFLDLDAEGSLSEDLLKVTRKVAEEIFMPITVGGGVTSLEDFRALLESGADKVSINTAAVKNPQLIGEASQRFGAQCVVLSIDYRRNEEGRSFVWIRNGSEKTEWNPVEWAKKGVELGAGEILVTSIDRDGTGKGMDCEMIRKISESVTVPVIAAGGCGLASHFIQGYLEGNADAVAAGTYFSFRDNNPMQARSHIRNSGIPLRFLT